MEKPTSFSSFEDIERWNRHHPNDIIYANSTNSINNMNMEFANLRAQNTQTFNSIPNNFPWNK